MNYKRSFYVVNDDNNIVANDDCDGIRCDTQEEAEALAKRLTDSAPGHIYEVVSTVSAFVAPIGVAKAIELID